MEWSARSSERDRPFGSWADALAAAFVPLEPRKIADQPFHGTISRIEAGPIRISRVRATRHRVLRLPTHIARSRDDLCFVNLQCEGAGRYWQSGHEQVCGPGDMAVADTTEPFEIANARDFHLFCFAVPRHLLPPGFSERPRFKLSASEAGRALSRTLAGYAELCLSSACSDISGFGAHMVDLMLHATDVMAERLPERFDAPVLLSMMLDHIDRHGCDPELDAGMLARKFQCSERYVHRLFSRTGRSVGEHINDRRITASMRELLDARRRRTIAEIAFASGFRDISHFNRLFKRHNGTTPREFRRAMDFGHVEGGTSR